MKKRIFSFFLVFCMALSLIPAALAEENAADTGTETRKMEISGRERTDTGLKCQVSVTGFASGDALLAVTLQASGKMKTAFPVALEDGSATLELDDVADSDTVKFIWTDANQAVRIYKETRRPEAPDEFGSKETGDSAFSQNALNLIARPQYLSAAAEKELEETEKKAETDPYAYKRLIVSADGKLPDLSAYGNPTVYTDASSGYSILQFGTEENAKACEAYLSSLPAVQYAEPDSLFKRGPTTDTESPLGADEAEFMSWGVTKINADVLAKYLKSQSGLSTVIVAVADTGVEADHPFLQGRLTKGFDFIENDDDPNDQHSHGTHVSGTIVDCTLGLDNILIMPIRVLGASGGGTAVGIALGIRYATDNGANVINLSLGGGHSNYLDDAISYAISNGVTVVVAAGNEGDDVMAHCPAHVEDAITVAAVDSKPERASFSNYGAAVDVAAPGVQIKSSVLNKGYANKSGTSMATPHVAAAAAMIKCANPDMSPADIQQALKDTATDLGASGWDGYYGYGMINLEPFAEPATTYSLTYQASDGGEVSGPASAAAGDTVTLTVSPNAGYALEALSVMSASGEEIPVRDNAFSMPDSDVTVTASFAGDPTGTYQIVYKASEGGAIEGPDSSAPNNEVVVTAIAYDGYALKDVSVDGKSLIGASLSAASGGEATTFAFTMPDHDVTVEATFENTDEPQPEPEPEPNPDPVTGHAYELFETGLVWDEAKAYCEKLGGHLMTVTSAEEQKILEGLLEKEGNKNSYWLGATEGADGNYAWITGEAFSYTNWANNQPDNHHGTEDSLMVYRNQNPYASSNLGEWNDLDHDGTCLDEAFFGLENFGFICEWDGDEPVKQYVITATADEGGEISPSGDITVAEGASQTFTIQPNSGYKISAVEADGKDAGAVSSYEFPSVSENHTIVAHFEKDNPEPESIFALLYQDGELVFQNDDKPRQDKPVLDIYPVDGQSVKEGVLDIEDDDGDVSSEFGVAYAEWYDRADIITSVTILDKIQPTSTALWFHGCKKLTTITGLEKLDTSKVTNMSHMFSKCALLPAPDLSGFDTSNVTNMSHMFYGCKSFEDLYLENFDTSAVTDMGAMFSGCAALHRVYVTDSFVTTAVTASSKMFSNCSAIEGTYGTKFEKAHVDKEYARLDDPASPPVAPGYFSDSRVIEGVANVYLYDDGEMVFQLHKGADPGRNLIASYTIDVAQRDASVDYALWNEHSDKIKVVTFADPIRPYATSQWFYGCRNLKEFRNMANLDTRHVTDMSMMFSGCAALPSLDLSAFNTANVENMKSMFENCAALTALDVSGFDTANVTNMSAMFQGCAALKSLSLDAFNVSKVTNMSNMFRDCASLTALDLSAFNTASVTGMDYMFRGCAKLAKLDVSKFNTSKVSDMKYLFSGCASLASLDLSAFNTANVKDMRHMFSGCASMKTLDVSKFNTAKVTNMSGMFQGSGLTALNLTQETNSAWNTGKVTNMENMFRDCSALTTINVTVGAFSTDAVTNSANMFADAAKLVGGRGTAYDAAHIDKEYARIDFGERQPGYFTDPNMLVLTFNPNDSAEDPATGVMEEQLFSKGVAEKLSPNQFSREGYDFKGWNTKPDGSGKAYADEASITLTDDLTLYAQWDYSFMENFYAILYSDGELVFQWNDTPESGRSVVKTYVTDRQGYSENRAEQNNFRAWHNEAAQIKTATFAKRIQPDDIAQWFQDCPNLTTIRNLQKLDTSLVTDMSNLFAGCGSLKEADLSAFDTSKVKNMEFMFEDCGSLTVADLSAFDTANVSRMGAMFSGCEELTTIYASAKFVTSAVTDDMEGEDMFMDCWNLVGGSGTAFDEDCTDMTYARIDGGASNPGYFTAG